MIPAIIKPGTHSSQCVWIKGSKPVSQRRIGDRIKYKPQLDYVRYSPWIEAIITGWCGPESDRVPMTEYV